MHSLSRATNQYFEAHGKILEAFIVPRPPQITKLLEFEMEQICMFDVKPKPPPQWTERYTFPENNRELESIQASHMEEEIKLKEIHYKLHKKNKGYLSAI